GERGGEAELVERAGEQAPRGDEGEAAVLEAVAGRVGDAAAEMRGDLVNARAERAVDAGEHEAELAAAHEQPAGGEEDAVAPAPRPPVVHDDARARELVRG